MKLSIVTTLYNSAQYIQEFHERITKSARLITDDFEIIFINDGSTDNSFSIASELLNQNENIQLIDFSKNFGHHKAIMAGLVQAQGDYVFLIDVDLEEKPELLLEFWNKYQDDNNIDMIYGAQRKRKGGIFERLSGKLFYKLYNLMSEIKVPVNYLTVRLMSKRLVKQLIRFKDCNFVFSAATELVGFNRTELVVDKQSKKNSCYNLPLKLKVAIHSLVSSTAKPLWLIFYFGVSITLISIIFIMKILFQILLFDELPSGWPSLILSIWFLGGVIIMFLGVIGVYISKIFNETKNAPQHIVRQHLYSTNKHRDNNE